MNRDLQLKLQAFLDGELCEREARRVSDWIETDAEARALLSELRWAKSALCGGAELERPVPENREFYWSKIERAIDRLEKVPEDCGERNWLLRWRRFLAPAASLVLVAVLAVVGVKSFTPSAEAYLAEVEMPSQHVGAYSFRSQRENMFVVWVYERVPESEPEIQLIDDTNTL